MACRISASTMWPMRDLAMTCGEGKRVSTSQGKPRERGWEGAHGDRDGFHNLLDHLGVAHARDAAVPADVGRDALEGLREARWQGQLDVEEEEGGGRAGRTMTAQAPAASAMRACSALTTSTASAREEEQVSFHVIPEEQAGRAGRGERARDALMTPPLSIWASPACCRACTIVSF